MNSDDNLLYKIALTLLPGVGNILGKKLVAYCGSLEAIFREKKRKLLKIPGVGKAFIDGFKTSEALKRAEAEMKFIEKYRIQPVFYLDKNFPARLEHCFDSPMMLFTKGNVDLNAPRILSVVGTRRATRYGQTVCESIIEKLSGLDIMIISGLAYGIDTCAHRSALQNCIPTTGVLAHGLDRIYPSVNKQMALKMMDNGGLITEFLSGSKPDRENFPKRNRIIAGLSDAVLVVEAGEKGGALITADIAISYNREVFALPGRIDDAMSIGCLDLIKRNKAALISEAQDLIEIMGWEARADKSKPVQIKLTLDLTEEEERVLHVLEQYGESSINWVCKHSGLPLGKVAPVLLGLEFKGLVKNLPGQMYRLYS